MALQSGVRGVVLMGPPGSGKSFIGTRLAELGLASYVELEPILVEKFGTGAQFLANKDAAVRFIAQSYDEQLSAPGRAVALESTGVSDRPLLERLLRRHRLLLVRVNTPREVCVERVATRARGRNIGNDAEAAGRFHDFWHATIEPTYDFACAVDGTHLDEAVDSIASLLGGTATTERRLLSRDEIAAAWRIDRSESVEALYRLVDGALVLEPYRHEATGWPPGEAEIYTPILEDCFDHGGWFHGCFENGELFALVVLDGRFMGRAGDQLQLKFLHVGRSHRDEGVGRDLFLLAAAEARARGAKSLYVSATPTEHTIHFYLRLGCKLASTPDPELFALEPEDIHLEYALR